MTLGKDASRIRKNPGIFARMGSFANNILRHNQFASPKTDTPQPLEASKPFCQGQSAKGGEQPGCVPQTSPWLATLLRTQYLLQMPTRRRQWICPLKTNSKYLARPNFPKATRCQGTLRQGTLRVALRTAAFDARMNAEFHWSVQHRTIAVETRNLAAFRHHAAKAHGSNDAKTFDTL